MSIVIVYCQFSIGPTPMMIPAPIQTQALFDILSSFLSAHDIRIIEYHYY